MDVALSKLEQLRSQSPTVSHSSSEPLTPTPTSRVMSSSVTSSVHSAMLSHGHDILSKLQHKVSYSSPPPIACSPENNVCKLIDYRGAKVAAFVVEGRELICLPQAFELFLKHLVGGLHTVYTKLKRLDITPVVCNVEQVRILRGLGAIQPGVNRCKLISCKEFDILYDDCTNSSARPGRPPKRSPSLHASPETIEKLKKTRFDGVDYYNPRLFDSKSLLNGFPHHPYAMGPLPFMQLNHPLLPPPATLAMAQQLGLRHEAMVGGDHGHLDPDRGIPSNDDGKCDLQIKHSDLHQFATQGMRHHKDLDNNTPLNLHINGHAEDLRKSPGDRSGDDDDDDIDDDNPSDDEKSADSCEMEPMNVNETGERTPQQNQGLPPALGNTSFEGFSSIETLLLNIQGLLKVAAENARHQERQLGVEKAELKMELYQEKKMREEAEKQLQEEHRQKMILQKRLKKERRARKKLEDQLTEPVDQRQRQTVSFDSSNGLNTDLLKGKCALQESDLPERFGSTNNIPDSDRNGPTIGFGGV